MFFDKSGERGKTPEMEHATLSTYICVGSLLQCSSDATESTTLLCFYTLVIITDVTIGRHIVRGVPYGAAQMRERSASGVPHSLAGSKFQVG